MACPGAACRSSIGSSPACGRVAPTGEVARAAVGVGYARLSLPGRFVVTISRRFVPAAWSGGGFLPRSQCEHSYPGQAGARRLGRTAPDGAARLSLPSWGPLAFLPRPELCGIYSLRRLHSRSFEKTFWRAWPARAHACPCRSHRTLVVDLALKGSAQILRAARARIFFAPRHKQPQKSETESGDRAASRKKQGPRAGEHEN